MNKAPKIIAFIATGMIAVGLVVAAVGFFLSGGLIDSQQYGYNHALFTSFNDLISEEIKLDTFTSIAVEADCTELEMIPSNSGEWKVTYFWKNGTKVPEIALKDGVLRVHAEISNGRGIRNMNLSGNKIQISYPRGTSFQEIELRMQAAEISAEDFSTKKLTIDLSAGNIKMEQVKADEIALDVQAGNVALDDCTLRRVKTNINAGNLEVDHLQSDLLDVELQMGNAVLDGITGEVKVDLSMGNIELTAYEARESYTLDLSATAGGVSVDDESEGRRYNAERKGAGNNQINAKVQAGSISLEFE